MNDGKGFQTIGSLSRFISLLRGTPDRQRDSESHHQSDAASEKAGDRETEDRRTYMVTAQ